MGGGLRLEPFHIPVLKRSEFHAVGAKELDKRSVLDNMDEAEDSEWSTSESLVPKQAICAARRADFARKTNASRCTALHSHETAELTALDID